MIGSGSGGGNDGATVSVAGSYVRPQPIRDAILAFLSEPRQAWEMAAHIGRSVPNATGHLAAMCRRSLALRVGYGRYARMGPSHYSEIALAAGRPVNSTLNTLRILVRSGLAVRCRKGVFAAPAASSLVPDRSGRAVCATRGDA